MAIAPPAIMGAVLKREDHPRGRARKGNMLRVEALSARLDEGLRAMTTS